MAEELTGNILNLSEKRPAEEFHSLQNCNATPVVTQQLMCSTSKSRNCITDTSQS